MNELQVGVTPHPRMRDAFEITAFHGKQSWPAGILLRDSFQYVALLRDDTRWSAVGPDFGHVLECARLRLTGLEETRERCKK